MKRKDVPTIDYASIQRMEDMSFFTHALIFDDVLIVAQKETNCFVLNTQDGLILIDAIWPSEKAYRAITGAIRAVGWQPEAVQKLLLTHGHVDHTGCGRWFVEQFGTKTYLSQADDFYWETHPAKPDRPETWKDYQIDVHLRDGDTVTLGDKTVCVYATPGHTPGCLSFIFPVTENGQTHMAALWGGAAPPRKEAELRQYLRSLDRFQEEAKRKKVEVALSNHTAFDQGLERIAYSRNRLSYMPNIYIIGQEGFQRYCQVFRTLSNTLLKQYASLSLA